MARGMLWAAAWTAPDSDEETLNETDEADETDEDPVPILCNWCGERYTGDLDDHLATCDGVPPGVRAQMARGMLWEAAWADYRTQ